LPLSEHIENLKKEKSGRLTLLYLLPEDQWKIVKARDGRIRRWPRAMFQCDCGTIKPLKIHDVLRRSVTSCGCFRKDDVKRRIKERITVGGRPWTGYGDISKTYWNSTKLGAVSRGIKFAITMEQGWELYLKQGGRCAYTGWELTFAKSTSADWIEDQTASLDRIDSKGDYILGNVQWVHKDVNKMKWAYPHKRFLELALAIDDNWGSREKGVSQRGRTCAYTGWELTFAKEGTHRKDTQTASLDRIDSSKGYVSGNVQWVHKDVNKMKSDFSHERFLQLVRAMAAYHRSGGGKAPMPARQSG
jgi:hypothetical protein